MTFPHAMLYSPLYKDVKGACFLLAGTLLPLLVA